MLSKVLSGGSVDQVSGILLGHLWSNMCLEGLPLGRIMCRIVGQWEPSFFENFGALLLQEVIYTNDRIFFAKKKKLGIHVVRPYTFNLRPLLN